MAIHTLDVMNKKQQKLQILSSSYRMEPEVFNPNILIHETVADATVLYQRLFGTVHSFVTWREGLTTGFFSY